MGKLYVPKPYRSRETPAWPGNEASCMYKGTGGILGKICIRPGLIDVTQQTTELINH